MESIDRLGDALAADVAVQVRAFVSQSPVKVWLHVDFDEIRSEIQRGGYKFARLDPTFGGPLGKPLRLEEVVDDRAINIFVFELSFIWIVSCIQKCVFCLSKESLHCGYVCRCCIQQHFDTSTRDVEICFRRNAARLDWTVNRKVVFCVVFGFANTRIGESDPSTLENRKPRREREPLADITDSTANLLQEGHESDEH